MMFSTAVCDRVRLLKARGINQCIPRTCMYVCVSVKLHAYYLYGRDIAIHTAIYVCVYVAWSGTGSMTFTQQHNSILAQIAECHVSKPISYLHEHTSVQSSSVLSCLQSKLCTSH